MRGEMRTGRGLPAVLLLLGLVLASCGAAGLPAASKMPTPTAATTIAPLAGVVENGTYSAPKEVAAYLSAFGHLPSNYLTKAQAVDRGWESSKGNLWEVAYGSSIGGDLFGNREGLLPKEDGRKWYECDVGYQGGFRGAERLVYSNDGLIYYSDDHYRSFTRIDERDSGDASEKEEGSP